MNDTPRLRSGFPETPRPTNRRRSSSGLGGGLGGGGGGGGFKHGYSYTYEDDETQDASFLSSGGSFSKPPPAARLPLAPENVAARNSGSDPVIPLTLLDGPQQRLYAFAVYVCLWAWKLYDWLQVVEEGEPSWWLFLKWTLIDFIFLYGLPELRVPWLELSQLAVTGVFSSHMLINYMLMFNIPLPLQAWLLGVARVLYDREISVSEHHVKVSNILNNHSLIMGKQVINILPEGSAVLNPELVPFCLSKAQNTASLPIYFNATVPAEIEFIRLDLETSREERIKVSSREINKVAKLVREHGTDPDDPPFLWHYPVKKPGVYRLGKVLDEYKLEVQRAVRDTYVVRCPTAKIKTAEHSDRCIRDLSDLSLEVFGTPPLKIVYSRAVNGQNHDFTFPGLQPDGFSSPLEKGSSVFDLVDNNDVSWVRPREITVPLNESLTSSGEWEYSVNEVHDVFGNVVLYAQPVDDPDIPGSKALTQRFTVKDRPKVRMNGCDLRNPLRVARGRSAKLPVSFALPSATDDTTFRVSWKFSPIDSVTNSGDHGDAFSIKSHEAKNSLDKPMVSEPGLYTLQSISSGSCEGEIDEPSSCLLLNPLEPHLSLKSEEIPDKCAGNSVGLRVDFDLVGTPPFTVRYDVISDGKVDKLSHRVNGLRSQLELVPTTAGHFKYIFHTIDDDVYKGLPLAGDGMVLEQVVKPAASAIIVNPEKSISACLESEIEVDVLLSGDPPFNLEWETVHDGKRKTEKATDIHNRHFKIKTATLSKGGEYILALSSVQDNRGCRTFLQDSVKISVRRQRPRGAFGLLEQKYSVMAVEDTALRLPLRLQGEAPWTISYKNLDAPGPILTKTANNPNDFLLVRSRGTYEIVGVSDKQCPGVVEPKASTFEVDWFQRPVLSMLETESVKSTGPDVFIKHEVCEGDVDGFEVRLKGAPPYHVQYEVKHTPAQGSASISRHKFDAAMSKAGISMDTSKAGDYSYQFSGLADNLYNSDKNFHPLIVQQRVNAKPSATFAKPGQTFKYCQEEQELEDVIPITLTGLPPFHVEVEIKHQAGTAPETYRIPAINSNNYGMTIPRQHLRLGTQQLRLRTVRDARGCQQKYEVGGPSIQVQLYDAPSIYPLESRQDYCVGERIAYTLSGTPPFDISYDFNGQWNAKSQTTSFRRIAEKPGDFIITSIADKASECRAAVNIPKTIHPLPSVQISRGKHSRVDIHEGNEVDILFEFWGTPPFEFTYTRSTNAKRGQRSVILETRHDVSYEHSKVIKANQEGTYEVVAIKDKYCSFSTQQVDPKKRQ